MNVLVTGGAGYVGAHLAEALRRAGHAVRVLDLRPAREEQPAGPEGAFWQGSIGELGSQRDAGGPAQPEGAFWQGSVGDPELVARAVRGVEVIYHMAWAFYPDDERRELGENVLGTLALLQAALAAGVRHLQFASSAVVYGPTGPARTSEEHPCHPERSSIGGPMYGIAKLACEGLCLAYGRRGLPVTVWRMHGVLSAGRLGPFAPMIAQALRGEPVRAVRGAGGEYVHLADVIRALLLAVRTSSPGEGRACGQVLNLAGTHTYRDPELARYIVETAGSGSRVELVEDPAQGMISLSVDRLRQVLGYEPREGEFLSGLIQSALEREA